MSTQTKKVRWLHRHQAQPHAAPAASAQPEAVITAETAHKQQVNVLMDEIFTIESGFGLTDAEAARLTEIAAELSRSGQEAVPWIRWQIESDLTELLHGPYRGKARYQQARILCEVLGRIGGSEAYETLKRVLTLTVSEWEYETVRLGAARGLGYLGDKLAIPLLEQRQQLAGTTQEVMDAYQEALQALTSG